MSIRPAPTYRPRRTAQIQPKYELGLLGAQADPPITPKTWFYYTKSLHYKSEWRHRNIKNNYCCCLDQLSLADPERNKHPTLAAPVQYDVLGVVTGVAHSHSRPTPVQYKRRPKRVWHTARGAHCRPSSTSHSLLSSFTLTRMEHLLI